VCLLLAVLLLYILKKFWCQLPENREMMAPKHIGAEYKIMHIV
jgi:hypothetical protein